MALLKIEHILICEETRPELGAKTTMLGVFGMSPYVKIDNPELRNLARLSFVFYGAPPDADGEAEFGASFGLKGEPSHFPGIKLPKAQVKRGKAVQVIIGMVNVPMPRFGRYAMVLTQNGREIGAGEFEYRQADNEALERIKSAMTST